MDRPARVPAVLTPYSLWELGHNLAHHGFTNLKGRDYVWTPYSPHEFARLSWVRRRLERIYRSGVGQGVYYMVEMWWKKLFFPRRKHVITRRIELYLRQSPGRLLRAAWIGGPGGLGSLQRQVDLVAA